MDAGQRPSARFRRAGWRSWISLLCLVGFALVLVLALGARPRIEAGLTERARETLERTGESWAYASFTGRDAILTGEALAEQARSKVRAALAGVFGVRTVTDRTTLLPERRPFTFSAVRDGATVMLTGYVPSEMARARILAAARVLPGVTSVKGGDQLVRARGAPAGDFAEGVVFGLHQLAALPSGRITLSDNALALEGRSPDLAVYDALSASMHGDLPQGFRLSRFALRPPVVSPFRWTAVRDGARVRLDGHVPSHEARRQAADSLKSAMPDIEIDDGTRLADGAPATDMWLKAVAYGARQLALLPQGRVQISDTALTLEGATDRYPVFDALQAARRAPPEGFTLGRFAVEPPRVSPFVWRAMRDGKGISLTGSIPKEESRRAVADAIRSLFPGVPVKDEARLASGGPAPEVFVGAIHFGLTQLAKMREGVVLFEDDHLTLAGEALDSTSYASILDPAQDPPGHMKLDMAGVRPALISPFVFGVRRDADGITLSGFFAARTAHDALKGALSEHFPDEKINDVSALGAGAPPGFADAVVAGMAQLARLEVSEMQVEDVQMRISGAPLRDGAGDEIGAHLRRTLPPGFSLVMELRAPAAAPALSRAECVARAERLTARIPNRVIEVEDPVDMRTTVLFDRLVHLARRCPMARIEMLTRANGEGASAEPARVEAIAARLAGAGIDPERVVRLSGEAQAESLGLRLVVP